MLKVTCCNHVLSLVREDRFAHGNSIQFRQSIGILDYGICQL
jgi:hypothetical protein